MQYPPEITKSKAVMPLFGSWIRQTADLQRSAYGNNPSDQPLEDWLVYIREQTLAAFVELGECIQNLQWKPWAKVKRFPDPTERFDAIEEIVDVLHFVANILYALDVTDEELNKMYSTKMDTNRKRMARGGH